MSEMMPSPGTLATIATIAGTVLLVALATYRPSLAPRRNWYAHHHGSDLGSRMAPFAFLLALALTLYQQAGAWLVLKSYENGAVWSSPFVMSIPSGNDFWTRYLPLHLSARDLMVQSWPTAALVINCVAGLALLAAILWFRRLLPELRAQFVGKADFRDYLRCVGGMAFLVGVFFALLEVMTFLFAFVLGTAMFLLSFWWVVLLILVLGSMGGGQAIYDRNGRKIGYLDK